MLLVEVLQALHKEQNVDIIEVTQPLQYKDAVITSNLNTNLVFSDSVYAAKRDIKLLPYYQHAVVKIQSNYDIRDWHMLTLFIKKR